MFKENEKGSVLIVDDSRANIMALGELLRNDWTVKVANGGEAALRIAKGENPPDIILLDVMMPKMNGYEVIKILKELPETKDIPVIFITALDQDKDEEYGLSLGAIDFITKPFSPALVKARVKNHIELKKMRDLLKEASMVDGLTGIPNRRRFNEALTAEWGRALRYEKPLSLIMADIDHFKYYNDTYGHLKGDECLKKVANTLKNSLKRPLDLVSRWGGEEFACLLPDTDSSGGDKIAEELRKDILDLKIPHSSSLVSDFVTISLGTNTIIPTKEDSPEILEKNADEALYKAKEMGRNRVYSSK